MNKQQLRKWAKEERKKLNIKELSSVLVKKLCSSDEYIQAKNIMLFYPLEYEINLLEILKDDTKNFYLPKIDGENLLCCPYKEGEELCDSCFKTKEPLTSPVEESIIDLLVVPALAVDKNNYRLGYGGGFYDRFLSAEPNHPTLALCYDFQIRENLPTEEFDIPVDTVIWD